MGIVEAALILTVAAPHLAGVPGRVRSDQLVPDAQLGTGSCKERDKLALGLRETVGEFQTVIGLDAFDRNLVFLAESICFCKKSAEE